VAYHSVNWQSGVCAVSENDVTPKGIFDQRRRSILAAGALMGLGWSQRNALASPQSALSEAALRAGGETQTSFSDITSYNNYYEFSTDKKAVKFLAQELTIKPWTISVEGEVEKPYTVDADDLTKLFGKEERIYRLRCVEGWAMVVPWSGFALSKLIERARPISRAKFVEFESLKRSSEMIGEPTLALPRGPAY
jgi:methionine sulfoxide reductase catalytic subunit